MSVSFVAVHGSTFQIRIWALVAEYMQYWYRLHPQAPGGVGPPLLEVPEEGKEGTREPSNAI